ncbi:MAG: DUF4428 domain-containing protein [Erysipelotrichaceae bacterium]|nr:DUF4428 domain-containing protein [Erysipelotrichaceae bacterium]
MGVLGNLFERKNCDICGKQTNIFGGTKLENGRLCKDCANKLSPYLSGVKHLTVDDIRDHLAYREENAEKVKAFDVSYAIGGKNAKLYIDMEKQQLIVSNSGNWRNTNPDILNFDQIVNCDLDIKENRTEIKKKDEEGKEVSYDPKRYEYSYNFYVYITVNASFFNSMSMKINGSSVDGYDNDEYEECYLISQEICEILDLIRNKETDLIDEAVEYYTNRLNAPKRTYNKNTYYSDTRKYSRTYDYYLERDPRKNHYKF